MDNEKFDINAIIDRIFANSKFDEDEENESSDFANALEELNQMIESGEI